MLLLILMLAAQATPEAELAEVRAAIPAAVDDWEGNLSDDDRPHWKDDVALMVGEWLAFRDAQCVPALLPPNSSPARCKDRITRLVAADLRKRYDLGGAATSRRSFDGTLASGGAEPCEHAPMGECDYCGINHCWGSQLKRQDAALNQVYRAAIARMGKSAQPLRASQRLWLKLRDDDCELEGWETPNRFAHSIYSTQFAPCVYWETAARLAWLRALPAH